MHCTSKPHEVLREMDNDNGNWWERYTLTATADVTEGPQQYEGLDDIEVEAVDSNGDVESWHWDDLSSREQLALEADLIADYQRQAPPRPRCPHCRLPLEGTP